MSLFLYIDVDAFFASVEQAINRALVGRPVMVGGLKHERGVVACPSYEARARGVHTGTPLHEAARLIPDGIFLKGDFNRYEDYSQRFYHILESYTPELDKISQDEACLNIAGAIRPFGDCQKLAMALQSEIKNTLGLSTSIGIAPSRVASKIASEQNKPYGLTILTHDNMAAFMEHLPLRRIPGIGHVKENILNEMGIHTAGQLAQVPENYLKMIFGLNGLKIAAYCRGEDGPLLRDHRIIRSISRETGFADDITDHAVLLSHFYYLLERAAAKLRTLSKRAGTVKVKFRYADFQTIEGAHRVHPFTNDESKIYPLIEHMFTRLFTRRIGIRLVGVTLTGLKNYVDNETFLNDRVEKDLRLRRGLDSIRAREGFFSLMTGRTWSLETRYKKGDTGFELRTPGLSQ
jgi:DNA polymerase-4